MLLSYGFGGQNSQWAKIKNLAGVDFIWVL